MIQATNKIEIPHKTWEVALRSYYRFLRQAKPPKIRSLREFASQELVIPEGKYEDEIWRPEFQPVSALYFDAIDSGQWCEFALTGPVQSGKSLSAYVAAAIWHLCEYKESIILAAPTLEVARDKWLTEVEPFFRKTRYASLLPTAGSGSKGGFASLIELKNGAKVKFMSAGGGDEKRSSFSSRVVIITEADKMDVAGATSRESSPLRQLFARTESYDAGEYRIYIECTTSIEEGYIWQAVLNSTNSKPHAQCPCCRGWISPEREHLIGVKDAETLQEAELNTRFACYLCGYLLSEAERSLALRGMKVLHKGQLIDSEGRITGEVPYSRRFGMRYSAFHNAFWSTAKIAAGEFEAVRAKDADSAERARLQFVWARPYEPSTEAIRLDEDVVTTTQESIRRGVIPAWADCITAAIDVGKTWLHWATMAWRKNLLDCPPDEPAAVVVDYGSWQVLSELQIDQSIEKSLLQLIAQIDKGYLREGSDKIFAPSIGLIDVRYQPSAVRAAIKASDAAVWYAVLGFGSGDHYSQSYRPPKGLTRTVVKVGSGYHVDFSPVHKIREVKVDVDEWKSWAHRRFSSNKGPGSVALFSGSKHLHRTFFQHLSAEQEEPVFDQKRNKEVSKFRRIRKQNHFLDVVTYNGVGATLRGVTALEQQAKGSAAVATAMEGLINSSRQGMNKPVFDSQYGRGYHGQE